MGHKRANNNKKKDDEKSKKCDIFPEGRTRSDDLKIWFGLCMVLIIVISVLLYLYKPPYVLGSKPFDRQLYTLIQRPKKVALPGDVKGKSELEDVNIIVTSSDTSGVIRFKTVKSSDLSPSWIWRYPGEEPDDEYDSLEHVDASSAHGLMPRGRNAYPTNKYSAGGIKWQQFNICAPAVLFGQNSSPLGTRKEFLTGKDSTAGKAQEYCSPTKHARQLARMKRKERRARELMRMDKETDTLVQEAAIKRAKEFDISVKGKYSISSNEKKNPKPDCTIKQIRDHIIMAKVYASIAKDRNVNVLYNSLINHVKNSLKAIGDASLDSELNPSAFVRQTEIRAALSSAKDQFHDCNEVARKLRVFSQLEELKTKAQSIKSTFLTQVATKSVPREMHCLTLLLTSEYYQKGYLNQGDTFSKNLENPVLYHYAIISDNVFATSVVVNSAVIHAKKPAKHVFHVITDAANFAAMKMWFIAHPPGAATIRVENIEDFTWLNSSYFPVMRQLESPTLREYYFKTREASSVADVTKDLDYGNPKYLSPMNHLRFYLPDVYPKLDKILFLDDDTIVQKDLTPLWNIDLNGMVNGAVETCKEKYKTFNSYLNFSNPKIADNFDPEACGWAFGMNIFDLKEWRRRDITGIYRHWQNLNDDRTMWKLGTLPAGLVAFNNLTYPIDRKWHLLTLGYNMGVGPNEIKQAGVIHYNGHYKPWLDIAITKYKSYWSKYIISDSPYVRKCHIVK